MSDPTWAPPCRIPFCRVSEPPPNRIRPVQYCLKNRSARRKEIVPKRAGSGVYLLNERRSFVRIEVAVAGVGSQNLVPAHTQAGSRQTGLTSIQSYLSQRLRTILEGHSAGGRADEGEGRLNRGSERHGLAEFGRIGRARGGDEGAASVEEDSKQ